MGSWEEWWPGERLVCLWFCGYTLCYLANCKCFCSFVQVRDEYRTDYDPDILFIV